MIGCDDFTNSNIKQSMFSITFIQDKITEFQTREQEPFTLDKAYFILMHKAGLADIDFNEHAKNKEIGKENLPRKALLYYLQILINSEYYKEPKRITKQTNPSMLLLLRGDFNELITHLNTNGFYLLTNNGNSALKGRVKYESEYGTDLKELAIKIKEYINGRTLEKSSLEYEIYKNLQPILVKTMNFSTQDLLKINLYKLCVIYKVLPANTNNFFKNIRKFNKSEIAYIYGINENQAEALQNKVLGSTFENIAYRTINDTSLKTKINNYLPSKPISKTIASTAVSKLLSGPRSGGASSDISVNQLINEIRSHGELKELFEASVNEFKNNGIKEIAREILEDKYIKNNKQNKIRELPDDYEKNILTLITAWKTAYYKQKLLNCAENIGKQPSCPTDYKELEEIFRSQYILNSIDNKNLIGCILKRVECMKAKVNAGNLYKDILVNFEELLESIKSNAKTQEELFIKTSNYLYTCINTTKNTNKFQELQIYLMILKEKIFPKLEINAKAFGEKNCKKTK